ncbi:uncharacterized protein LOC116160167 [Photinus pyralis]|uniref:uncharacterized protein LOC116160167 n=1 Tax=Photinus pyralis TaxID=7054 RepID=UPI0012676DDA|nr:uncharacterized protein LOC116160167 [Photinus pyralis]
MYISWSKSPHILVHNYPLLLVLLALNMLLREFYLNVGSSQETATNFLRQYNLLDAVEDAANCHRCGSTMQEKRRRDRGGEFRPILRCPRKGCQTTRSVRNGNTFFHYNDLNGRINSKLSLVQRLELIFLFLLDIPIDSVVSLTGRSNATVIDWFNMCREVCSSMVSYTTNGRLTGTREDPVQIDEARFAGRRKYGRGRMLQGDAPTESEESDDDIHNNRNHGRRIDGPWVFGLRNINETRYFYVARRDAETLLPIIQREVEMGSVIHSDEWPAYRR